MIFDIKNIQCFIVYFKGVLIPTNEGDWNSQKISRKGEIIMAKKKNSQTATDIINTLARTTSLSQAQVKEVFVALECLMNALAKSNYAQDLSITIPYLGKITFSEKKGKKAGSTYKQASGFGGNRKTEIVTIEEDEPDYLRLKFDFMPKIQNLVKEESRNRSIREMKYGKVK